MRLTLRTLLAYLDDTLPPDQAKAIGTKVAESETAAELIDRIRKLTRKRGLSTPSSGDPGSPSDPNTVSEFLGDTLSHEQVAAFEKACLENDVHLAEVAACHQILTLLLSEPVRVPPTARQRMYQLVKGRESLPNRKPGGTVPVAGEIPDLPTPESDETDAALLLGMRAYSRTEPWKQRVVPLAMVGALAACFLVACWFAIPSTQTVAETADASDLVPMSPPQTPPGPAKPAPAEEPPAKEPEDRTKPREPAPEPKPQPMVPMVPKIEPPPIAEPAQDAPPKDVRLAIGKLLSTDAVVVSRSDSDGKWQRATEKEPDLFTTDRIVCLPGYKAKVHVEPGVDLELWGNVPEQQPFPILDSSIRLYQPVEGINADLEILTGRVYLFASEPQGAKFRVRFQGEVWDISLPNPQSEVAIEVVNRLTPGIMLPQEQQEKPETEVSLVVTRGTAKVAVRFKEMQLKDHDYIGWSNKGAGLRGPSPLDTGVDGAQSAYFSRFELPIGDNAKFAQEALAEISRRAVARDTVPITLVEFMQDNQDYSPARVIAARIAVVSSALLKEIKPVIDALNDPNRPFMRDAGAMALISVLGTHPELLEVFVEELTKKHSLNEEQLKLVIHLLRGFSDAERTNPAAIETVLEALNHPVLIVRELAFWSLQPLIDPEVTPSRTQLMYNAAAPAEVREPAVRAWRKYLTEDLRGKEATPAQPPKP